MLENQTATIPMGLYKELMELKQNYEKAKKLDARERSILATEESINKYGFSVNCFYKVYYNKKIGIPDSLLMEKVYGGYCYHIEGVSFMKTTEARKLLDFYYKHHKAQTFIAKIKKLFKNNN